MRPRVILTPLPIPAEEMPGWRAMWPGEWRYRAFMLTMGWRIAHVAAWFISVGINCPSGSSGGEPEADIEEPESIAVSLSRVHGCTGEPRVTPIFTHIPR